MRLARKLIVLLELMLITAVPISPAVAYQEAGHYYTVALLAYSVTPRLSPSDARIIAFCTQLPDQSADLDAVVVYQTAITHSTFSWLSWAFSSSVSSPEVRRMVTVQQLLHGLTGGTATAVRSVAATTVRTLRQQVPQPESSNGIDRAAALCALGFALHLYGDSFAHQIMGAPGDPDPDKVYSTGKGHAADMHYPDLPLCAAFKDAPRAFDHCATGDTQRFLRWHQGWAHGADLLGVDGAGGTIPADLESTVSQKMLSLIAGATDTNLWNEAKMESALASFVADAHPVGAFFAQHDSSESCGKVLDAAIVAQILPPSSSFQCQQAWDRFATVAAQAFASTRGSRESMPFDPAKVYVCPFAQSNPRATCGIPQSP